MSNFDAASFNPGMQITLRFAAGYLHSLIVLGLFMFDVLHVTAREVEVILYGVEVTHKHNKDDADQEQCSFE